MTRRRQRARAWLALTVGLHVSILALTIALLPLGRFEQASSLVIIIALAAGPLAGMVWLEQRHSSARQPHKWPWRSLVCAFPQATAWGFAMNGVLDEGALAPPLSQPRYWPVWALTSGLATAIVVAVGELGLPALLGPILGVLLTWAARQLLIRPVSTDLAGSRLEIPLRLRGGVTLLVQHDRLLLKVSGGAGGAVPQALPLGELALAQLGQFTCDEARCCRSRVPAFVSGGGRCCAWCPDASSG